MIESENIGIIILAAGQSSRLGSPKQLLKDRDEQTLLRRVCNLALAIPVKKRFAVLGFDYEMIAKEISDLNIDVIFNKDWQMGIASSIKSGVKAVLQNYPGLEVLIFLVCDQPFINKELILSIIDQYITTQKSIVAGQYQSISGTPALFHRSMFTALMSLEGDRGAGKIIKDHMDQVALVNFEAGIFDIDSRSDYEQYLK